MRLVFYVQDAGAKNSQIIYLEHTALTITSTMHCHITYYYNLSAIAPFNLNTHNSFLCYSSCPDYVLVSCPDYVLVSCPDYVLFSCLDYFSPRVQKMWSGDETNYVWACTSIQWNTTDNKGCKFCRNVKVYEL